MSTANQSKSLTFFKYFLYFLLFLVLAKANIYGLIFPFCTGLFFALLWCNQKIYFLIPLYIWASLIISPTLATTVSVIGSMLICIIFFAVHTKLKKQIKLWLFIIYMLISQIPYIFSQIYFLGETFTPFITTITAIFFTIIVKEILLVILHKGFMYKLNLIESISALVFLCAISCGLYGISFFGFDIYKLFAFISIFYLVYSGNVSVCILTASIIGIGGLMASGNATFIAPLIICSIATSIFKQKHKFLPIISVCLVELVLGFYINIYPAYSVINFLPVLLASFIFLLTPKKVFEYLSNAILPNKNSIAMRNVVNRSRENLCRRLYDLSSVFAEMDYVFRSMIKGGMTKEQVKTFLISEIKDKVCADCSEKNLCHRMCLEETSSVFEKLISSGLERGKTTLLDIPPYLTGRCNRINNLVGTVNNLCSQYRQYAGVMNNLDASRVLIAEQLCGVSKIMKNLANEVNKNISFDNSREEQIMSELSYYNILCCDAIIYEQNVNVVSATLVVRKIDSKRTKIPEIVSKICKNKMIVTAENPSTRAGWNILTLKTATKYDIVFGTAGIAKDGNKISGDCYSVIKISADKFLLALCDGMGSGESAKKTSSLAIGLVENFYKAGFDNEIILSSINKLLSLNREEIFSALDVCVLDSRQATADFIKMGAVNSYIKHKNTISKIAGGTLPLGIIQDVEPTIIKQVLQSGDYVFLFTDGVSDSFANEEELQDFINNQTALNPQVLAEELLAKAVDNGNGARDDMTVIVAKIFDLQ